jgi:hypothetical protein
MATSKEVEVVVKPLADLDSLDISVKGMYNQLPIAQSFHR